MVTFRIATMDCAVEDSEIRNALERVAGIKALRFQLGNRTLGIDAPAGALEAALVAIRRAGFDPQPVAHVGEHGESEELHDHTETAGPRRLALALALAFAAEALDFFAPDSLPIKGAGLALAAVAICSQMTLSVS